MEQLKNPFPWLAAALGLANAIVMSRGLVTSQERAQGVGKDEMTRVKVVQMIHCGRRDRWSAQCRVRQRGTSLSFVRFISVFFSFFFFFLFLVF